MWLYIRHPTVTVCLLNVRWKSCSTLSPKKSAQQVSQSHACSPEASRDGGRWIASFNSYRAHSGWESRPPSPHPLLGAQRSRLQHPPALASPSLAPPRPATDYSEFSNSRFQMLSEGKRGRQITWAFVYGRIKGSRLKSCFRTWISWGNSHDTSLSKKLKMQSNQD